MSRFLPSRRAEQSARPETGPGDRRVFITGAASGLGLALAREYLALGER